MLNDQLSKCWLRKSWKSRGDREIFSKILKVERRKRNGSKKEREIIFKSWKSRGERETFPPDSWKSRGERDMKISFSRAREKNLNHFSSRISRDRDSCQCLNATLQILGCKSSSIIVMHCWKNIGRQSHLGPITSKSCPRDTSRLWIRESAVMLFFLHTWVPWWERLQSQQRQCQWSACRAGRQVELAQASSPACPASTVAAPTSQSPCKSIRPSLLPSLSSWPVDSADNG